MATTQTTNITQITAPRVDLIDSKSGLMSREWYRFFYNLYTVTGGGDGITPAINGGTGIGSYSVGDILYANTTTTLAKLKSGTVGQVLTANGPNTAPTWGISTTAAPVTKTADFTLGANESWVINNKSGSTCTVTLPAASAYTGRQVTFKNMQAQFLVSASANVVPIDSTSAGTAILLGVVGNWATIVSDGTNWIIMQAASNNNLLLE
jgi:hypothetical protein